MSKRSLGSVSNDKSKAVYHAVAELLMDYLTLEWKVIVHSSLCEILKSKGILASRPTIINCLVKLEGNGVIISRKSLRDGRLREYIIAAATE